MEDSHVAVMKELLRIGVGLEDENFRRLGIAVPKKVLLGVIKK